MTAPVELGDIAVVDNHCHAVEAEQPGGVAQWRQLFSESPDPRMRTEDVAETVFYRRLLRRMAAFHHVPPTEADVLGARAAAGTAGLVAAPATKLMYSSDGGRVPELHWAGAHDGRRVLGDVLGELVSDGDLSAAEALRAGELILRGNARRVYGLTGRAGHGGRAGEGTGT